MKSSCYDNFVDAKHLLYYSVLYGELKLIKILRSVVVTARV